MTFAHSLDYYDQSDSSGTDDDLPPTHSGRAARGVRVSGNGRLPSGPIYAGSQSTTIDHMVHNLEQEAYTAVLRAFGAQSEVITWAKERLMTDLRKELRVSDEQHRECLGKVVCDETVRQIQQCGSGTATPADISPPPAVSQSRKRQKTAHTTQATLPPQPPLKPTPITPSVTSLKRGAARGKKGKGGGRSSNLKGGTGPGRGSSGRSHSSSSKILTTPSDIPIDPLVGRKVKTRWPEDNEFYEAVITDYDTETGFHALVYDMSTTNETWEWINLKEVAVGDLKWVDGPPVLVGGKFPPPGVSARGGGMGRGSKKSKGGGFISPVGRGRGRGRGHHHHTSSSSKGGGGIQNGLRSLQLLPLEELVKEVDKLEDENDLEKLENAKKAAKAHEEALRKALAEVGESSDEAESDDRGRPLSRLSPTRSHSHSLEERQHSREGEEQSGQREGQEQEQEQEGADEGDENESRCVEEATATAPAPTAAAATTVGSDVDDHHPQKEEEEDDGGGGGGDDDEEDDDGGGGGGGGGGDGDDEEDDDEDDDDEEDEDD